MLVEILKCLLTLSGCNNKFANLKTQPAMDSGLVSLRQRSELHAMILCILISLLFTFFFFWLHCRNLSALRFLKWS